MGLFDLPLQVMTESSGVTYNQLITELSKSAHGKLSEYVPLGLQGAAEQSEFFAHLIAYNEKKGQIRDSKVALPLISLSCGSYPLELVDNSLAHLALLSPRDLLRGYRFGMAIRLPGHMKSFKRMVARYLRVRESNWPWFTRTALQHKRSLQELYALSHTKRSQAVGAILFGGEGSKRKGGFTPTAIPAGTVVTTVSLLKSMNPQEAAGEILNRKIPFQTAMGALGENAKHPVVVMALMKMMTPSQFITNQTILEGLGVRSNPILRSAYEEKLAAAAVSKKVTYKTTKAIEALDEDNPIRERLKAVQEKQIDALGGVEGNWVILGDKSGSMDQAIEVARMVAGSLARSVRGKVYLVFFDNSARGIDVSHKTYAEIKGLTGLVKANGGTSVGVGLECVMDNNVEVDGIAIVSDCYENVFPQFATVYKRYCFKLGRQVPVYIFQVAPGRSTRPEEIAGFWKSLKEAELVPQIIDLRNQPVDEYSLPTLVQSMRVNRYSLVDEIMSVPLLSLNQVLPLGRASA